MAGKFILSILGSASAKPSRTRESSAQLLQAAERLFLIDCSEGCQRRMTSHTDRLKEWAAAASLQGVRRVSKTQLDAIFISHVHGDHMFGLFPLLSTMSLNGRKKPLTIFGPSNLGPILNFYKSFWGDKDPFELVFVPLKCKEPEVVLEYPGLRVEAFPLRHGIDCFGYIFRETPPPGLSATPAAAAPLPRLRSYAYCSDTAPFEQLPQWVCGVDVLYHEATYMRRDAAKALARFHSTTADAATCALEAGAGRLLVGHYSSALRDEDIAGEFIAEVREIFPAATAVSDGDIYDIL